MWQICAFQRKLDLDGYVTYVFCLVTFKIYKHLYACIQMGILIPETLYAFLKIDAINGNRGSF